MKYKDIIVKSNPSQSHWELNQLLLNLENFDIKNILEIGIHRGGSMRVWRDVFKPEILIGIDGQLLDEVKQEFDHNYLIQGYSQTKEVVDRVNGILGNKKLDFLFIDGGHLYNEVKRDFEIYSTFVRKGGVIGFHDVVIKNNDTCEVYKFWEEIRKNHNTCTIWDGVFTGEGLLFL